MCPPILSPDQAETLIKKKKKKKKRKKTTLTFPPTSSWIDRSIDLLRRITLDKHLARILGFLFFFFFFFSPPLLNRFFSFDSRNNERIYTRSINVENVWSSGSFLRHFLPVISMSIQILGALTFSASHRVSFRHGLTSSYTRTRDTSCCV